MASYALTACAVGSVRLFPMMAFCCRSYSLKDGISTGALREYARAIARLLCPRFTWRTVRDNPQFSPVLPKRNDSCAMRYLLCQVRCNVA